MRQEGTTNVKDSNQNSSSPTSPVAATFKSVEQKKELLKVDFNPTSLKYTITNTLPSQGGDDKRKQNATQSSAQLSMDLVFDSTDSGSDIRQKTSKVAAMMKPANKVPPAVEFEWGAYSFIGFAESYTETIDFFSHDGIPLRATISLTLAQKENVFDSEGKFDKQAKVNADPVEFTSGDAVSREDAENNNLESPRQPGDGTLLAFAEISIGAPLAFASGAAGAGISAGASASAGAGFAAEASIGASAGISASAGASAGASVGASASFGASASASFGASASAGFGASVNASAGAAFGSSASAGVSAREGAFAGLRVPKVTKGAAAQTHRRIEANAPNGFNTEHDASFEVGGKARIQTSSGFRTNVDAESSVTSRIEFED